MGRGGLVRDEKTHRRVLREMTEFFAANGMVLRGLVPSPIPGGDGNREYLAWLGKSGNAILPQIDRLAAEAAGRMKRT